MKKKATFSIDEKLLIQFNKYAEENTLNKSKFIEKLLKGYLEKHDN